MVFWDNLIQQRLKYCENVKSHKLTKWKKTLICVKEKETATNKTKELRHSMKNKNNK